MLRGRHRSVIPSQAITFRGASQVSSLTSQVLMLSLGIVGLPNVGKSSLFNALTAAKAEAANYPFCTIDPNVGVVNVPDPRLERLAEIVKPERTVPAAVQFVDIAGLVKGASTGEGRGNAFLSNIRETDAIVHVVRCFDDEDVIHVDGSVDPVRDRATIEFELALADLAVVEKRLDKAKRAAKTGDKDAAAEVSSLEKAHKPLADGQALWHVSLTPEDRERLKGLQLLTLKPILYAANVTDGELTGAEGAHVTALRAAIAADHEPAQVVTFSAKIEMELAELPPADKQEFLASLGIESAGLDRLIRGGYSLLGLQTYFTAGEKEVRAWTIKQGDTAPKAAGVIHTDFEKGFIRAETVSFADFVAHGGWKGAREKGVARAEGKEYVMQDGDVVLFRFNV